MKAAEAASAMGPERPLPPEELQQRERETAVYSEWLRLETEREARGWSPARQSDNPEDPERVVLFDGMLSSPFVVVLL
jgi:hypothetical protein